MSDLLTTPLLPLRPKGAPLENEKFFLIFLGFLASIGLLHKTSHPPITKSLFKSIISKSDKLANWTQHIYWTANWLLPLNDYCQLELPSLTVTSLTLTSLTLTSPVELGVTEVQFTVNRRHCPIQTNYSYRIMLITPNTRAII